MINSEITLRLENGDRSVEFHTELPSLTDQIVNGELISENTLHFANDEWLPLSKAPFAPWTDLLVGKAISFVAQNNPQRLEYFAEKTIRFGGEDLSNPAVRIAYFLLGDLDMVAGNYARAAERFHAAASGASPVLAAAHHNLGVCLAHRRQLVGAYHHLNLARAEDPGFFAADLSLRALAMTMLDERAPNLPRSPSWSEIIVGARQRLAGVSAAKVNGACAGRGPFPTFHVIHVFRRDRYFPPLSCGLSQEGDNGPAASRLLQAAEEALSHGDCEQALCLANRAGRMSTKLRPTTDAILAAAKTTIAQTSESARARRYSANLARFFYDVQHLTLDCLDEPRESLELIAPHSDGEEHKHLTAIYMARRIGLVLDALAVENDEQQRARLLQLAAHEISDDDNGAYARALTECRARKHLAAFRQAIRHGELDTARTVLQKAQFWLGDKLGDAEHLLDDMYRDQQLQRECTTLGKDDLISPVDNLINVPKDGDIKTRTCSQWDVVTSH